MLPFVLLFPDGLSGHGILIYLLQAAFKLFYLEIELRSLRNGTDKEPDYDGNSEYKIIVPLERPDLTILKIEVVKRTRQNDE